MDLNSSVSNITFLTKAVSSTWVGFLRITFMTSSEDLPEIILILSLICTVGGRCNYLFEFVLWIYLVNVAI